MAKSTAPRNIGEVHMGLVFEWTTESYMYLGNLVPLVSFVTSLQVFFFETFSELPDSTNFDNLLPFHVYSLPSIHLKKPEIKGDK